MGSFKDMEFTDEDDENVQCVSGKETLKNKAVYAQITLLRPRTGILVPIATRLQRGVAPWSRSSAPARRTRVSAGFPRNFGFSTFFSTFFASTSKKVTF